MNVRKTGITKGWIDDGVVLDANGVTWTPTNYSQRHRGMPILKVSCPDVAAVHLARQPGIGDPAVLEVQPDVVAAMSQSVGLVGCGVGRFAQGTPTFSASGPRALNANW